MAAHRAVQKQQLQDCLEQTQRELFAQQAAQSTQIELKDYTSDIYRNMDEQRGEIPSQSITLRSSQPAVLPGQVKKRGIKKQFRDIYRKCVEDHFNSNDTRAMWKSITAIN